MNSHWKWKKLRLIKRTKAGGGFTQRQFYRQTLFLSAASSRIFTGDLDGFYLNILSCGICLLKTFSAALEALYLNLVTWFYNYLLGFRITYLGLSSVLAELDALRCTRDALLPRSGWKWQLTLDIIHFFL